MSDAFEFEAGDRVLVRIRENGTSGSLEAKFVAEVDGFTPAPVTPSAASDEVKLSTSWAPLTIRLHPYEAEFEVLEDDETPRF